MSKFKKGDIVKGRDGPSGFGIDGWEDRVGQLATVIDVTASSYHVKWFDDSIKGTVFSKIRFEFVSSLTTGDKARVTEAHYALGVGTIVTVGKIFSDGLCLVAHDGEEYSCYLDKLESPLASEEKSSEEEMTDEQLADVYRKSFALAQKAMQQLLKRGYNVGPLSLAKESNIQITKTVTNTISL